MMLCTNKRERVRETMDQTQTQGYVSRFEPLALRPRLHREGFLIHYTPTEGTSNEEDLYNTGSTELLSQYNQTSTEVNINTISTRGVGPQTTTITSTEEGYKLQLHLSLEGANQQPQPLPKREQAPTQFISTKEGYKKSRGLQ